MAVKRKLPPREPTDMALIEAAARDYAEIHARLDTVVSEAAREARTIRARYGGRVRDLAGRLAAAKERLAAAIDKRRDLFARPKTRELHGVKVGLRKQPGRLVIDCDDATFVDRMIAVLGNDQAYAHITVIERPDRDALKKLPEDQLRRLGVEIQADTDQVFVRMTKGDVEKAAAAFLAEKGGDDA